MIQDFEINVDIYSSQVRIITGESSSDILAYLEITYGYSDDDDEFEGKLIDLTQDILDPNLQLILGVLLVNYRINPGLISHELYHAVASVMRHLGINNEEASAYLHDYLVQRTSFYLKTPLLNWFKNVV